MRRETSPRWKALLCGAGIAAAVLAGCRKSENGPAPRVSSESEMARHPPFGFIDTPKENEAVTSGSRAYGWALDDSGVRSVAASLDNVTDIPVEVGQNSPAVRAAYPTFPNSDQAGFIFAIPSVAAGPHLLVVTITGKDGGRTDLRRHLRVTSLRAE